MSQGGCLQVSIDGLLVVDKPVGPTSHDVVDVVRRLYGQRKVGHTGTLDPGASGVLLLCLGRAARLVRFLQEGTKLYTGRFMLGVTTDTLDFQGTETERTPCETSRETVEDVMSTLTGSISQTPPMTSAVKVGGRKLYELAREGRQVSREPRLVRVARFELKGFTRGDFPIVDFEVECGRGTYVRALAAEVGERVGCGAHVVELRRARNGSYGIDDAHTLAELEGKATSRLPAIIGLNDVELGLPELRPNDAALRKVGYGAMITSADQPELADVACDGLVAMKDSGRLLAVYRVECAAGDVTASAECVLAPASGEDAP